MATPQYISGSSNVAAATSTFDLSPKCNNHAGFFQVSFNSGCTGTVTVQGRINTDHDWYTLASYSGDGLAEISILPFMQVSYATSGGTFSAHIMEAI